MTDWRAFDDALHTDPQTVTIGGSVYTCYGKLGELYVATRLRSHRVYLIYPQHGVIASAVECTTSFNPPHTVNVATVVSGIVTSTVDDKPTRVNQILLDRAEESVRMLLSLGLIYPATFVPELLAKLPADDPLIAPTAKILAAAIHDRRQSPRLRDGCIAGIMWLAAREVPTAAQ